MSAHPFTVSTLAIAARKLDNALALLEEYIDGPAGTTAGGSARVYADGLKFSSAYRELLEMRGLFHAAQQLEAMSAEFEAADTERPSSLRLVK